MSVLAAIILTKNEEADLPSCLDSLRGVATEVHVIDSGSTDATLRIAHDYGATVYEHPFETYSEQFNWALDNIATQAEWIFRIDADERVTAGLGRSIQDHLRSSAPSVTGLQVARSTRFLGTDIRWGDTYPVWLLRIWRRGYGRCENTWMDEHIVLDSGATLQLAGDLVHIIPKNLAEWTKKHVWYAGRECQDILQPRSQDALTAGFASQASRKRWLKDGLYLRLPLFLRAVLYWFYRYFFRLGFLDGRSGFIYHLLHAFWYRFLVDAMLFERASRGKP